MKAIDIAKYLLYKANQDGEVITNLKMQKLLYYAQAWYLVNFKRPLFEDKIEAWSFGPVIKSVYQKYKEFIHMPIIYYDKKGKILKKFSKKDQEFLNEFYNKFINYTAHDLVSLSHSEEPFIEAYKSSPNIISLERMKDFYSKQYKDESSKKKGNL